MLTVGVGFSRSRDIHGSCVCIYRHHGLAKRSGGLVGSFLEAPSARLTRGASYAWRYGWTVVACRNVVAEAGI